MNIGICASISSLVFAVFSAVHLFGLCDSGPLEHCLLRPLVMVTHCTFDLCGEGLAWCILLLVSILEILHEIT